MGILDDYLGSADPNVTSEPAKGSLLDTYLPPPSKDKTPKEQEYWQGFSEDPTFSGIAKRIGIGAIRGAKDIVDTGAHGLSNAASYVADKVLPESTAKQIRESAEKIKTEDKAAREEYEKEYGTSRAASVGRVGGQIAATIPIMPAKAIQGINVAAGAMPTMQGGVKVAAPLINRLIGAAGTGAAGGAVVGAATSSSNDKSLAENVGEGALTGAVAGPVLSAAGAAGKAAGSKILGSIDTATAQLAKRAEQLGIDLKGSQVSPSFFVKKYDQMSGQLPFSGATKSSEKQLDQFYKAVSRTFGENTSDVNEQLIKSAKSKIGAEMENIKTNANNSPLDRKFAQDLTNVLNKADYLTPDEKGIVHKHVKNIFSLVKNGELDATSLHNLTKYDAPLSDAINGSTANVRPLAGKLDKALKDLMERNLSPQDQAAWKAAKAKYKAASTVGEWFDRAPGEPNPLRLLKMVKNAPGGVTGGGTLSELGEIARKFFVEPKDSGTPIGEKTLSLINAVSHHPITALAAGAGAVAHGAFLYDMGAGATAFGINRAMRSAVNSKAVRNSIVDTALGGNHGATEETIKRVTPYLPVIRKDEKREPLRITVK